MRQPRPSRGLALSLLATLPSILAIPAIAVVVAVQAGRTAARDVAAMIEAKRRDLRNDVQLARSAFVTIYGNAAPDDAEAKLRATWILPAMVCGDEGFFFVYDDDGTNLAAPRQT